MCESFRCLTFKILLYVDGSKCASFSVSERSYIVKEMGCNKFHLQTSLQCHCEFTEHLLYTHC